MRIWSLHPKYLDAKGLVALWRETLLAKNVLEGKTKAYLNHPQLNRFKETKDPIGAIHVYLDFIWQEAKTRGYNFNSNKFDKYDNIDLLPVNSGQLAFEKEHLLRKLAIRDQAKFASLKAVDGADLHSLFYQIEGEIELWEKV